MKKAAILIVVLIIFQANACTHRHKVAIEPQLFVKLTNDGALKKLDLKIIDKRRSKNFYLNEGELGAAKVSISPHSGLSDTLRDSVKKALNQKGFRVSPINVGLPISLAIEILHTRFKIFREGTEFRQIMKSIFRVSAINGSQSFSKVYTGNAMAEQAVPVGKFLNEKLINQGIQRGLQKMLDDFQLIRFLSSHYKGER